MGEWVSFLTISVLVNLTPGPDMLAIASQSFSRGRRDGLLVTLGVCLGLGVHTALVAAGVGAMLQTWPRMLHLLQFTGAVYMAWLGARLWRRPAPRARHARSSGARHPIMIGFGTNLSNPKVVIFLAAYLPLFVESGAGRDAAVQILGYGAAFVGTTALVGTLLAMTAGSQPVARAAGGVPVERFAAASFVLLAAGLGLSAARDVVAHLGN